MTIVLSFIAIIALYLALRSHFNAESRMFQDPLTRLVATMPELSLADGIDVLLHAPPKFYSTAVKRMLPYFSERFLVVLALLALLLAKELVFRRREIHTVFMWLAFAVLTLAMPVIGRIFFIFKGTGFIDTILFPWYFCYPIAGVSIALGFLLRPTPSLEKSILRASPVTRAVLFASIVCLLAALNVGRGRAIRVNTSQIREENARFHGLVMRYKDSMASFLQSADYSPDEDFQFMALFVDNSKEYSLNWALTQRDIFHLYFPHVENIRFMDGGMIVKENISQQDCYIWTPETVTTGPE